MSLQAGTNWNAQITELIFAAEGQLARYIKHKNIVFSLGFHKLYILLFTISLINLLLTPRRKLTKFIITMIILVWQRLINASINPVVSVIREVLKLKIYSICIANNAWIFNSSSFYIVVNISVLKKSHTWGCSSSPLSLFLKKLNMTNLTSEIHNFLSYKTCRDSYCIMYSLLQQLRYERLDQHKSNNNAICPATP